MSLASYTSVFPFEYCAARFLRQWETRERPLFEAFIDNPTNVAITKALGYFQVARNFAGLSKVPAAAETIRKALIEVRTDASPSTPVAKVEALAASLEANFGQFNLSAASKLLWLSFRAPYVIYDKRALIALSEKGAHKLIAKNYSSFTNAWRVEYEKFLKQIESAIANLPQGRAFMPITPFTNSELTALSTQSWFKERVFDTFLWEVGGDG